MKRTTRWYWILAIYIPPIPLVFGVQSCVFGTDTCLCESGRRCAPGQVCAAAQDVCINVGGCGDGIVNAERGEVCDDGNIRDRDGCSKDCKSNETCGNGIVDMSVGETCDIADPTTAGACSPECEFKFCGNSIIDIYMMGGELVREVCDDGNAVSGDGCRSDCLSNEVCGNGLVDQEVDDAGMPILDEQCDPEQPGVNTVTCDLDCTFPACGDGVYNREYLVSAMACPGELQCDQDPDTGQFLYTEQCDEDEGDSAICDEDCTIPICGDGHVNMVIEECDPGPAMLGLNTPDCNANCTQARCGDGFYNHLHLVTPDAGEPYLEECDEGTDTANCDSDCTLPMCGDQHVNITFTNPDTGKVEECDSGALDAVDCDFDCTRPVCGDGHFNAMAEECDEGGVNAAACDRDCTLPACGDGIYNAEAEDCDTGGDSVNCDFDCTIPACGDGHKNSAAGEVCDSDFDCGSGLFCRKNCTECS